MTSNTTVRFTSESCGYPNAVITPTGILARVERHIRRLELRFGREQLLRTMATVGVDDLSQHVDRYRAVVRTGRWLNQNRPTTPIVFCGEYERAAIAYSNVAFDVLDFLAGGATWSFSNIYRRVVASEALRGQFGKRSPTGLDQRLDRSVVTLEARVLEVLGSDEINDQINLLCTPTVPWLSAEAALLEDFAALRMSFPSPPSIDEIASANAKGQEAVWTFLRRHVRWSVQCMERYYTQFSSPMFTEWLVNGRRQRNALAIQRRNLVANILKRVSAEVANEIIAMASEITVLNELNLALEPCFSFKGGPGVPHGLIFKATADSVLGTQITDDQLQKDKWNLFFSTTLQGD